MNLDPTQLPQKSLQILTHLVEEIGPRPAGSPAEKRALDYLEEGFKKLNLTTTRFPVIFQPEPAFFPYYMLAAVGFLAAGLTFQFAAWTSFFLPALVLILPEAAIFLQGKLNPSRGGSSNLLVSPRDTPLEKVDIIFCAHIDTARAIPVGHPVWQKWRDEIFFTIMRIAILLSILALLQLSEFSLPPLIVLAVQILTIIMAGFLIAQDLWEQVGSRGKFTRGANDNASGCAVLASLAQSLASGPLTTLNAGFLFTGAEECGLHGARQFANHLAENNLHPMVISVDMIGAGSGLRIITRSGTLFPVKTSSEVNELLKRADPMAEYHAAPRRWGDFAPFIKAGIPAGHLENTGTPESWSSYHTAEDEMDVIDPEMVQHTGEVLIQLLWILEKNKQRAAK